MYEQRYNRFTARHQRRRRRQRLVACLRCLVVMLALALVVEGAVGLLCSPRFQVTTVRVQGATFLGAADLAPRLALPAGCNLFRAPIGRLQRSLAAHPALAQVSVHRRLPGTLIAQVRERRPVVFARCGTGIIYLDRGGRAFWGPPELATRGACELTGLGPVPAGRCCRLPGAQSSLVALGALRKVGLRPTLISITPEGLAARLQGGTAVILGKAERLPEKARVARLALDRLSPRQGMEYVDLTSLEVPVWKARPLPGAPPAAVKGVLPWANQ